MKGFLLIWLFSAHKNSLLQAVIACLAAFVQTYDSQSTYARQQQKDCKVLFKENFFAICNPLQFQGVIFLRRHNEFGWRL